MSPSPQHGTPAGDAAIAIRGLARQTGADVQELMTLYALEGLLARFARSEFRENFVLKGGVLLTATLGTARLTIGIDVNFGDPIWPAPRFIDLPRVAPLDLPSVTLLGYPLTMVLAEKIVTAVDRGIANTRWRDFADVYTLVRLHPVDAGELRASIETVSEYRKVALAPLLPTLTPMNERAQQKYRAWRTRSHREGELPAAFADVLSVVAHFADPVLTTAARGRWNPRLGDWEQELVSLPGEI